MRERAVGTWGGVGREVGGGACEGEGREREKKPGGECRREGAL